MLFNEDDERERREERDALDQYQRNTTANPALPITTAAVSPTLPPVLARILGTDNEDELMAVAKFIDERNKRSLKLLYHIPKFGVVSNAVNWCNVEPSNIHNEKNMILVMLRSKEAAFSPIPGSEVSISFVPHGSTQGQAAYPKAKVTCLTPPMPLYPHVGIDLLCFLPQTPPTVQKEGKLKEGAPSTVSGKASNSVDEDGEPIVEGEKSASLHKAADAVGGRPEPDPSESFDIPREG